MKLESFEFWSEIIKRLLGEIMFSEGPSLFVLFCNCGALDLLRNVVDLSVSLSTSQPAETTSNLSMSIPEFVVLVLQKSNCFNLISFF